MEERFLKKMNKKIQLILHGLLLMISTLLVFSLTLLLLLNNTGLKANYIIKIFDKNNYYEVLHEDIKTEMLYYTVQSGFSDDIIDDTFTIDEVATDVNKVIKNAYKGKDTEIDTKKFEERLDTKIDNYITEKNFKIANKEELYQFTIEMAKIYVNKIKMSSYISQIGKLITKINKIIDKTLIYLTVLLVISLIINLIFFKLKKIGVILFANSLLLIVIRIAITSLIPIKNIFIYNDLVSGVVKNIINNGLHYVMILAIIYFVIGVIVIVINNEKMKKTS